MKTEYQFTYPFSAETLGVLLALVCLLGVWAALRQPKLRRLSYAFRLPFLLLIVALAYLGSLLPVKVTSEPTGKILALLDISESNDELAQEEVIKQALAYRQKQLALELLTFAGSPDQTPKSVTGSVEFNQLKQQGGQLNTGASNLEQILKVASQQSVQAVLLLSDGQENQGSALAALPALQAAKIKIFPLTPKEHEGRGSDAIISNFSAPLVAKAQERVPLRVALANSAAKPQSVTLELYQGDKLLRSEKHTLAQGVQKLVEVESDPSISGMQPLRAVLKNEKGAVIGRAKRFLTTGQRERVLMISGSADDQRFLAQALEDQGYELITAIANRTAPTSLILNQSSEQLKATSAIILNNIEYPGLASRSAEALRSFVQQGGGLLMVGGERSYGLGGYRNTLIADLLPVEPLPPQTEQKRLNLAVQLLLDKSGSMRSYNRMEFAQDAAKQVVQTLKDDDLIGVIGFDATPFVVIRLEPVASVRAIAANRIDRLLGAGRTNLLPALDEARRALARVRAGRKHIIILTDGKLPGQAEHFISTVQDLRVSGVTVSTVLVGGEADDGVLRDMANEGGGSFYYTVDPQSLPRIFLQDIKVTSGERTMRESQEYLVRPGPAGMLSTSISGFPPIRGYVQTKARPRANLELLAVNQQLAEPLLASWSVGQGKAIAFTADASGRWTPDWVRWPRYQSFWNDLLNSLRQQEGGGDKTPLDFDLRHNLLGDTLRLDLTLFNGTPSAGVKGSIKLPDARILPVELQQIAQGRFELQLPKATAGDYILTLKHGDRDFPELGISLSGEQFGDRKGLGINTPLLTELAKGTGGSLNPSFEQLQALGSVDKTTEHLSHWLFLAALLVFLSEILFRELVLKRLLRRRLSLTPFTNLS